MGASEFFQFSNGETAKKAFINAVQEAKDDYGHNGYTGTIAEKNEYVRVGTVNTKEEAKELAEKLLLDDDPRIEDKWGPAGAICINDTNEWLFFGWASS